MKRQILALALSLLSVTCSGVRAQWVETSLVQTGASSFATLGSNLFVTASSFPFVTSDLGDSWTAAGAIPSDADASRLLAWNGNLLLATGYYWILISKDTGKSWSLLGKDNLKQGGAGAIFAVGDTLFANTAGAGLVCSVNGGQSWYTTRRLYNDTAVEQFSLDGDSLFVGCTRGGVFRSSDNGVSWVHLTPWLGDTIVRAIATNGRFVYAGTWGAGIYRSTDYGNHWLASNNGVSQREVGAICVVGDTVFAGFANGAGVFMSTDSGISWHDVNEGLTDRDIVAFCVWHGFLFAGGGGSSGVWRRPLSDFNAVKEGSYAQSETLQCYPNPASSETTISFSLAQPSVVGLSVVDILGREIKLIGSKEMNAGLHSIDWDLANLPSGVFTCLLELGNVVIDRKLIVRK